MRTLFFIIALLGSLVFFVNTDYFDPHPTKSAPTPASIYLDETQPIETRVADLLSYMTLEEKIGQMILVEKKNLKNPSDIATYHIGALLSGGGSKPEDNTARGWREMINGYQTEAKQSRLGIPLLYGIDAIHGQAHLPTGTVFPHAIGLGATNNPKLVKAVASATAKELFATGVNWSFSPNLDQPRDIRWGRVYEAFSDDPALVSKMGVAHIEGLQTDNDEVFILATPKHFLGLGSMGWNTSLNENYKIDQGVTPADDTLLRSEYLPPFTASVEAGALSIMVGHNTWDGKRMAFRKDMLTDLLKEEIGFKGFLVSDWYGVHEGRRNKFWGTVSSVNAGMDMLMLPDQYEKFMRHMKWANRLGLVSDERINDAAGRILYAKFALGLFDENRESIPLTTMPNAAHKALAREAVSESMVLLKNEDNLLPLSSNLSHLRVAGSAADNVGRQMGAWTIEWQGIDGMDQEGATSILEGIKSRVSAWTTVEYDLLGNFDKGTRAPFGIAVVGEKPYAEGWGDTEHPILSDEDLQAIKNLQATCDQVVVVIVSGRPLLIAEEVDSFDALVAAWLPGSEGSGVSDVLFGHKPFVGKLPMSWPRYSEQLPITALGETADGTAVLFPRYFGLK